MLFGFLSALRVLSLVAPLLVSALAHGAGLNLPWPDPALRAAQGGAAIEFPSRSPFTPYEASNGAPSTTAQARLFLPDGASAEDPVPAVVLMHGAGGVLRARELTYARQFVNEGIAALVVDAFAPRRKGTTGFVDRLLNITESMLLADVYAGLSYLIDRPEIDPERVALVGFSYGGMVSRYAANADIARWFTGENGPRFAAHVAYYPPCIAQFADETTTGAPVLFFLGGQDATVDVERCRATASALRRGGSVVAVEVYPKANHQWDGGARQPRHLPRGIAACDFRVNADGTVQDQRTYLPMTGPFSRKLILGYCADTDGYIIARNDAVRSESNATLARFLNDALSLNGSATN